MCEIKTKNKDEKLEKITIELSDEEINHRLDQIEAANIPEDLRDYLIRALKVLVELDRIVGLQKTTILRLRKIFGKKSERNFDSNDDGKDKDLKGGKPKERPKGHGRNKHNEYQNIPEQYFPVQEYKLGDPCPKDDGGKLYEYKQRYHITITGGPPFQAKRMIHQTLRCNICGLIIEAISSATGKPKYDVTVGSMLSILHYSCSFPMYRLEKLQKKFFTPMPRSVQWMILNSLGLTLLFIYDLLYTLASNSEATVLSDDTKAKIQSHTNKLNKQKKEQKRLELAGAKTKKSNDRVELSTTGMRTNVDGHEIIVFITGKRNSGENIDELLKKRTIETKLVIMADASSKNNPTNKELVEMTNCNVHARREFKDIEEQYKEEVSIVVGLWKEVYKNEAHTKENNLTPKERLLYHQEKSTTYMNDLKIWCESSLTEKRVEPNSPVGKAISYVLRHWPGLTGFLRIEGCPLDTNILEGELRTVVMNRKNCLHFKTEHGALINDAHLSVVRSCELSGEDPFAYLNAIQNNEEAVRLAPEKWLPWNYKDNLKNGPPLLPSPE